MQLVGPSLLLSGLPVQHAGDSWYWLNELNAELLLQELIELHVFGGSLHRKRTAGDHLGVIGMTRSSRIYSPQA
jgi:hypothetical protein